MKLRITALGMLSVSLGLAGGCNDSTPLAPSSRPPAAPPAPTTTTLVVIGSVYDATWRPCDGCTVEIADDAATGPSALTDALGRFSLSATIAAGGSSVTLRASKEGYKPATKVASRSSQGNAFVSFTLESIHSSLDLTGTYKMTLEAAAQCTELPESVRRREYLVSLAGHAERPQSAFVAQPVEGTFDAFEMMWGVLDDEVAMYAIRGDGELPGIVERLGSNERLELHLWARPEEFADARSIRMPVIGSLSYCEGSSAAGCTTCQSQQHLLTLTRR